MKKSEFSAAQKRTKQRNNSTSKTFKMLSSFLLFRTYAWIKTERVKLKSQTPSSDLSYPWSTWTVCINDKVVWQVRECTLHELFKVQHIFPGLTYSSSPIKTCLEKLAFTCISEVYTVKNTMISPLFVMACVLTAQVYSRVLLKEEFSELFEDGYRVDAKACKNPGYENPGALKSSEC